MRFCSKLILTVILLLGGAVSPGAEPASWTNSGPDHSWSNDANWKDSQSPTRRGVVIDKNQNYTWIDASTRASCASLNVAEKKGSMGECRLIVDGGVLHITEGALNVGVEKDAHGVVIVCGGEVSIASNGRLNIGRDGRGEFSVNGGAVRVSDEVRVPDGKGRGRLNIHGGTLSCPSLRIDDGGRGLVDITEGELLIKGDATRVVEDYIAKGAITAYGGDSEVEARYDDASRVTSVKTKRVTAPVAAEGDLLSLTCGDARLSYDLKNGVADFHWQGSRKIRGFHSAVRLPQTVTSKDYPDRKVSHEGATVIVSSFGAARPMMEQRFSPAGDSGFLVEVRIHGKDISTNWISPIQVKSRRGVDIGPRGDNRALTVPFDNSLHTRYASYPINSRGMGYGVGAFYDNASRNGLVVGSITHEKWKTGVEYSGSDSGLNVLSVFGGAMMPLDIMPHAKVTGDIVISPTIYIGFFEDWREGMETFAETCAAKTRPLALPGAGNDGVPLGWKHFGEFGLFSKVTPAKARVVSDFLRDNLQNNGFHNERGTLYTILGAGGEFQFSDREFEEFVEHCHANGQKAGSYFCPFKIGGFPGKDLTQPVANTDYKWEDIVLRDGAGTPINDRGRYVLDATHPGTKQFIAGRLKKYLAADLDYMRMDFVELGALEGVHYRKDATGMEAYNEGMKFIADMVGGRMQINLAISPLFPHQFAHSRRISCDVNHTIRNTEYQLNSLAYGWWLDRLYSFNDPGNVALKPGGDQNEAISRVNGGVVCSGQIVNTNDLTQPKQQALAKKFLVAPRLMALAAKGRCFRAVEGDTGSGAPDTFVLQDGDVWYVAVFNYEANAVSRVVQFDRAGLDGSITYSVSDLRGGDGRKAKGELNVELANYESKVFELKPTD